MVPALDSISFYVGSFDTTFFTSGCTKIYGDLRQLTMHVGGTKPNYSHCQGRVWLAQQSYDALSSV